MDFIERWLHISPDGGSGASEFLILGVVIVTVISLIVAPRRYLLRNFIEYLDQFAKREKSDQFHN